MVDNINPNPVEAEAPPDESGMSAEDAATSAYDDWDRGQNGIAEGEREPMGKWLKDHADAAGTDVQTGLGALVETAAVLRNGDPESKRSMLGLLADTYNVTPMPSAEAPTQAHDEFGDPVEQHQAPIATEAEAAEVVTDFIGANPAAGDPQIQAAMVEVAGMMQQQGLAPHLPTMFKAAVDADPRFSDSPRQAQEADHMERARRASVQVTGGGAVSPSRSQSDDVGDILNELIR